VAPRFLVLFLAESDKRWAIVAEANRRANLSVALATERYIVLVNTAATTLSLGKSRGLIIGTLFHRFGSSNQIANLDQPDMDRILDSQGLFLIERYWGSYVALLPRADEVHLLRDPSGSLPCYSWQGTDLLAFASDAELMMAAGMPVSIDWQFLISHYFSAGLPSERTALLGLKEVMRGHSVPCLARDEEGKILWNPWTYTDNPMRWPREEQVERLNRIVHASTKALCSPYKRPILCISGGLDSSIVGATLQASGIKFSGITVSTQDPDGDERHYARSACASFGVELDEAWYEMRDVDFGRSTSAHLPRPVGRIHALAYDAALLRAAATRHADVIAMGNGGDNIFASSYSAAPIVDRLLSEGAGGGVFATIHDLCRLTGASMIEASAAAYRLWRHGGRAYHWRPDPLFLTSGAVEVATTLGYFHPWLEAPESALPGKSRHIASLLRIQQHLDGYERHSYPALVNPLMSQPMLEFCLSIPTWDWIAGGRDRSVARQAFARHLPKEIVHRSSKSGPDAFCEAILTERRAEIRERLMDGHLARQGILDPAALEEVLFDHRPNIGVAHARIMAFLDAEAWIDHWLAAVETLGSVRASPSSRRLSASHTLTSALPSGEDGRTPLSQ
jgi:asparagine synthase (glutamine-hydrolysing)